MRPAVKALLLLGGNVGDRRAHLRRAVAGLRVLRRSRLYETAPVGPSDRPYLNQVVEIETRLSPMGLLVECKRREARAGRKPSVKWAARPLDMDILRYGALKLRSPRLTIPHPLILERPFVLAPLADLAPAWRPAGGVTILRRLRQLRPSARIVRIAP